LMSFNIRFGRAQDGPHRWYRRRGLVFDLIRRRAPHVLGLQEATAVQLDELLRELPLYGAVADHPYGGRMGSFAAILFDVERLEAGPSGDFWLAPDPDGKRVRAWDADVARNCTWAVFTDRTTSRRFCVFNTHFDQRGVQARLESGRIVVERLGRFEHMPRLVMGDLNAKEDTPALEVLRAAGFRDTFRLLNPNSKDPTFHGFKGVRSIGRIDYILCDERWKVLAAEIVPDGADGRFASDHFAITAELAFDRKRRR
jgi:endonuclease/exonuclease/phosphatase family metal-dependent hydrolase